MDNLFRSLAKKHVYFRRLKQKKKHRVEKEGCVEEDTSYIEENVLWKKNVFMCKYLTSVIIQGTQWER